MQSNPVAKDILVKFLTKQVCVIVGILSCWNDNCRLLRNAVALGGMTEILLPTLKMNSNGTFVILDEFPPCFLTAARSVAIERCALPGHALFSSSHARKMCRDPTRHSAQKSTGPCSPKADKRTSDQSSSDFTDSNVVASLPWGSVYL